MSRARHRAPLDPITADGLRDGHVPTGDKPLSLEVSLIYFYVFYRVECDSILSLEQEQQQSWQKLTLFLATTGSACLEETHDTRALQVIVRPELLPDSMRVLKDPRELITTFVTYLIDLLISDSMARDVSRRWGGS